jgi:chromosome segregation ATPase
MKALNGFKNHHSDNLTGDVPELLKAVVDLDRQFRIVEDSLGTQFTRMNEKLAGIDDEMKKNQKRFVGIEDEVQMIRTETVRTNMRLETMEMELKSIHKELSHKSDLIIGKFNQVIELLSRIT